MTVNDYPVYLKMVLDQGYFPHGWYTPDEEQIVNDVQAVRALGSTASASIRRSRTNALLLLRRTRAVRMAGNALRVQYSDGAAVEIYRPVAGDPATVKIIRRSWRSFPLTKVGAFRRCFPIFGRIFRAAFIA
ncbi:MAG: hypothetical protein ACLRTQ_00500 [Candidatus Borkfalkia sp.]